MKTVTGRTGDTGGGGIGGEHWGPGRQPTDDDERDDEMSPEGRHTGNASWHETSIGGPTAIGPPGDTERVRIVVLPFVNVSGDAEPDYFSDGLTEEMTSQLGRVRPDRLGVIARTSAARFKHSGRSINEIGRELGVTYVVEGSVRQAGDRVRITAQLVDATDQTNLWTDTYDGDLADCLALQARVASQIARALAVELLPITGRATAHCSTANPDACRT